jgi:anti-anti-sigma factor
VTTLTLKSTAEDQFVVFTAVGELDLHTQDLFEEAVTRQLALTPVVVDLGEVAFLAISALRSLMVCNAMAGTYAHELYYARTPDQTRRLLNIAGLDEVLPIRASVGEAICSSSLHPPVLVRPTAGLADEPVGDLAKLDVG